MITLRELNAADDMAFLKLLAILLVDEHGYQPEGYVASRFARIIQQYDIDKEAAKAVTIEGSPSADDPGVLRDRLIDLVYKHYIGKSSSRVQAERLVDKIIETFVAFYEQAEEQAHG